MKSRLNIFVLVAVITLRLTVGIQAQTTNPPYLSQFPSIERLRADIKGKDAMDTAARQMGAFWQLQEIIKTLSGLRWTRNQLTPDEARLMGQYRLGYSTAEQPYANIPRSPSDPDKEKWWKAHSFYEVDEGFRDELFERFLSPSLQEQFFRVKGETKAFVEQRRAARAQALKEEQQQQARAAGEFERTYKQPEWKRKVARCIASGRSETQCFSEQLGGEVNDLLSLGQTKQQPAGLTMSGVYASPGGLSVAFGPQGAYVTCKAVSASANYSVRHEGGQLQIRLLETSAGPDEWQGQRVALPVRPDGRLSGAGVLKVSGRVVVGHKKETASERKRISEAAALTTMNAKRDQLGNLYVEEQVERNVPIYAPKTEQCPLSILSPTKAETGPAVLEAIFGSSDPEAPVKAAPSGLRMTGSYTNPSGLEIEFHADSAVLGCREAVVARDYTVSASGGQVLVNIQNGGTPLALELRPDGALAGPGQAQVNGRVMVGSNRRVENTMVTHDPIFQPVTDTCSVGVLKPARLASTGSGAVAGAGVEAPLPRQAASTAPAGAGNAPSATTASAVLTVTDAFAIRPGTPSPFAGQIITLWKDSWENLLMKAGVRPPPGTSVVKAWLNACASGQPVCQQVLAYVGPHAMANARFGPGRQAQFPGVPPGTYYVFAAARSNNQPLIWDLRVDLKPGPNAVTIEQRNSTPVN